MPKHEFDIVGVGGGTAGLVTTAGAAYLGAHPALIERDRLGGDCLWTGCVPSKALLASARLAHAMRGAQKLGLTGAAPVHAFSEVMDRMRTARDRIAVHDDPDHFRDKGVTVHFGDARFVSPTEIEVEGVGRIRSKRFVIATGARATVPPIPGLAEAGYLTHETAFDQDTLPGRIVVLGGGPIGLEFAQMYARLGATVTVVEMLPRLLVREDEDVAEELRALLVDEGIRIETGVGASRVESRGGSKVVVTKDDRRFETDEIFVATGRRPNTAGLDLETAGVELVGGAVRVDRRLRTSAPTIWAAGDVTGGLQFTHVAEYTAKVALQNALLPVKKRVDYRVIPHVTYTDPEVAKVGLGQEANEAAGGRSFTARFDDLDRAIADGDTRGFVKINVDKKGHVAGASIIGSQAGELLFPLVLAMQHRIPVSGLAGTVFPYPTRMEGLKRAADAYQRTRLEGTGGRILRKVVSWLK